MLKRGFKEMLAEANAVIETVSVADLGYLLDDPEVVLVDVRESVERDRVGARRRHLRMLGPDAGPADGTANGGGPVGHR